MLNNILRWLANRKLIVLTILYGNNQNYCPLCLSDVEIKSGETNITCGTCGAKLIKNDSQRVISY